jgi:hypothetical protein
MRETVSALPRKAIAEYNPVFPVALLSNSGGRPMRMLLSRNVDKVRSCVLHSCLIFAVLMVGLPRTGFAQTCLTSDDMDAKTHAALEAVSLRYFNMAAQGDAAGLRQNSIASVATDFGGIQGAINDNKPNLAGAKGTVRSIFELQAAGKDPLPRAEFLCGVFGKTGQTANSAVIVLMNLPPGEYAVAILDADSKIPYSVSFVLQQEGGAWKMGGFYAKASQVAGHDGQWFLDRAREFKAKGKTRNAWLYYLEARDLLSPVPFMSTLATDKIYDESQGLQPADLPAQGNTADLTAGGKVYRLTSIFPVGVGNDVDLVVKYQAASVADTAQAFQQNTSVIKELVAKYPEFRDAFAAVIARATEPSGKDYGTLLATKDIP